MDTIVIILFYFYEVLTRVERYQGSNEELNIDYFYEREVSHQLRHNYQLG